MSEKTGLSKNTIKANIFRIPSKKKTHHPRKINLVVDTTYWGKRGESLWGVTVFRDFRKKENLWWKFVENENLNTYREGKIYLENLGYEILSLTCDGFGGLIPLFSGIPVQFCQFHQRNIVQRYITKNPRLEAGIDLLKLIDTLTYVTKEKFIFDFKTYLYRYKDFLNEKTLDPITGRYHVTHGRLLSALRSIDNNLDHLFTYLKYPELRIPNTTNTLESHFSHIKTIISVHRGLKRHQKEKIIHSILLNSSIVKKKNY